LRSKSGNGKIKSTSIAGIPKVSLEKHNGRFTRTLLFRFTVRLSAVGSQLSVSLSGSINVDNPSALVKHAVLIRNCGSTSVMYVESITPMRRVVQVLELLLEFEGHYTAGEVEFGISVEVKGPLCVAEK
jgi:hypothetical protein